MGRLDHVGRHGQYGDVPVSHIPIHLLLRLPRSDLLVDSALYGPNQGGGFEPAEILEDSNLGRSL